MKLLLDTCAFIWFQADSPDLSPATRTQILDPSNEVYLSAVSVWEIARKYGTVPGLVGVWPIDNRAQADKPPHRRASRIRCDMLGL